jgi:2'-5' RNA ligase
MHRLFVAIRPPGHVRERLLDMMEGVIGARWQEEEQLHLTLRFVGEVDRHMADDVHAALAGVSHPRFEMALAGVGAFDRRGEPAILWAGVTPHEQVKALHKKVDQALARAGVEPDHRAFHPHITLARMQRGAGPIDALLSRSGGASSAPFPVDEFRLYESSLTPQGPLYTVVERYPLF